MQSFCHAYQPMYILFPVIKFDSRKLLFAWCTACYRFSHVGIRFNVLDSVVIHYAKITGSECFGYRLWHLSFCFYHFCSGFLCLRLHFLLERYSHCTAFFCLCLCYVLIGLRLVDLQSCAYVLTYIDVGNVNRKNFECCTRVKSFLKHKLRN